jgi:predicted nucleotidyltransferase
MFDLDFFSLRKYVETLDYRPLFVTVSGAHLYGFPSPDSDVDLRGCHCLPLSDVVGLDPPRQTHEFKNFLNGIEVELVSHDVGKYFRLMVKNNGYILEQILSPLVVFGGDFLDELRPLANRCVTKFHYHHYRGFYANQLKMLEKEEPKRAKPLLYAYRVLMTGIHLLRSGKVEANILNLNQVFQFSFINDLVAAKTVEKVRLEELDWEFHRSKLTEVEKMLDRAFEESRLPEYPDRESINLFLIRLRLHSKA